MTQSNSMKKTVLITCPNLNCKVAYYVEVNGETTKKIICPYCGQESIHDIPGESHDETIQGQETTTDNQERD